MRPYHAADADAAINILLFSVRNFATIPSNNLENNYATDKASI